MLGKIFINYRPEDSIGTAGRLQDRIAQAFGQKNLFHGCRRVSISNCRNTLLLLCGCVLLCLLVQGDRVHFLDYATNSDILLPVSYVWDIRNHNYAWSGFELPRIPSLFPDLVTYAALDVLLGDFRWAMAAYALLQGTVFIVLAGCVISRLTGARAVDAAVVFLAVLTVVTVCNLPDARHFLLVELMYLPVCHFGSFIMSLVGALLALRLIEEWRASRAALFTLCVTVADLSNRKFLIDFIVPLGVAGLVLIYLRLLSWRRTAGMVVCGIVGLLLARAADHLLVRQPNLPIDEIPMHMHLFFQEVPAYLASMPPATLAIIFIPYVVFAAMFVVWLWRRWSSGITLAIAPCDTTVIFLWLFAAVAIVGCVAALSAVYVWPEMFRYAEPAYFWPIIFVAAAAMPLLERWIAPLAIGQVAAVSIVIVAIGGWFGFVPLLMHWQHPLAGCLQARRGELGLKAGLASYWLSRPVTVSTNWSIQIDQVSDGGDPNYFGNDRFWYRTSFADPRRPPEYNFFVLTWLNPERLQQRFGPPSRIANCGSDVLWIYDDPSALYSKLNPSPQKMLDDLSIERGKEWAQFF